jgi:hypothetical protein
VLVCTGALADGVDVQVSYWGCVVAGVGNTSVLYVCGLGAACAVSHAAV